MSSKKGSPSDPLSPEETIQAVTACLKSNITPILLGAPGVGKTQIIREVGKIMGLPVDVILLAQREPVDFVGIPHVETNAAGEKRSKFAPPGDMVTDQPRLIFLDEFLQAPLETQRAASEIILERTVGGIKLHPDTRIVCASNRKEDRAGTAELLGHNKSRLCTLHVAPTVGGWLNWAAGNNIHPMVIEYIRSKGMEGLCPKIDHKDYAYPCPRTWEKVSGAVHAYTNGDFKGIGDKLALTPVIVGTIGDKHGPEFVAWLSKLESLPTPADITKDPLTAKIPAAQEDQVTFARTIMSRYGDFVKSGLRDTYRTYLARFHVDTLISAYQQLDSTHKTNPELAADMKAIRKSGERASA